MSFTDGVDITPLRYRMIAEAIDTRGTLDTKADDVLTRKAYVAQIKIPNIVLDMGLPATAFRLYVHLKRTAGDGGECFKTTRTLARELGVSQGAIVNRG